MKNKKFKNRFLFLIAAFAMSFSAGVSLRTKEAPVKTEASAITPGLDIYLGFDIVTCGLEDLFKLFHFAQQMCRTVVLA